MLDIALNNATDAIGVTTGTAASNNNNMDHLMTMPNYSYIFKFEDEFEHTDAKIWFNRYWTGCFYYVGIYMLVIFTGQQLMANRYNIFKINNARLKNFTSTDSFDVTDRATNSEDRSSAGT